MFDDTCKTEQIIKILFCCLALMIRIMMQSCLLTHILQSFFDTILYKTNNFSVFIDDCLLKHHIRLYIVNQLNQSKEQPV